MFKTKTEEKIDVEKQKKEISLIIPQEIKHAVSSSIKWAEKRDKNLTEAYALAKTLEEIFNNGFKTSRRTKNPEVEKWINTRVVR